MELPVIQKFGQALRVQRVAREFGIEALVRVLQVFERAGVNLSHIEKRPSGRENWRYTFFIDAEGHQKDEPLKSAINFARGDCETLHVLGSYPRARRIL